MLLALDTSSDYVSLALFKDNTLIAHAHQPMTTGQAESLFPMLNTLLKQAKATATDISHIAVAVGPGSFTGVRIGLATARAFALALNTTVIGITNFDIAAYNIKTAVKVVLNTKRGDFFVQDFDAKGHAISAPTIKTADQLKQELPFTAVGSGAPLLTNAINCITTSSDLPEAVSLGYIALTQPEKHQPAVPVYLREADVTI